MYNQKRRGFFPLFFNEMIFFGYPKNTLKNEKVYRHQTKKGTVHETAPFYLRFFLVNFN